MKVKAMSAMTSIQRSSGLNSMRVEQHRRAADQHHVAQMQVAMHLAHRAHARAQVDQRPQARERLLCPRGQRIEAGAVGGGVGVGAQFMQVGLDPALHGGRRAEATAGGGHWRHCVQRGDRRSEGVDLHLGQFATRGHFVETLCGVEAAHPQHIVDRLAAAADPRRRQRAGDRLHVDVQLRCGAPIEPQFIAAELQAGGERAEVEKAEARGLLQLVRQIPAQQHRGDVRLDDLVGRQLRCERGHQCRMVVE
jgi:hypothetical protein